MQVAGPVPHCVPNLGLRSFFLASQMVVVVGALFFFFMQQKFIIYFVYGICNTSNSMCLVRFLLFWTRKD